MLCQSRERSISHASNSDTISDEKSTLGEVLWEDFVGEEGYAFLSKVHFQRWWGGKVWSACTTLAAQCTRGSTLKRSRTANAVTRLQKYKEIGYRELSIPVANIAKTDEMPLRISIYRFPKGNVYSAISHLFFPVALRAYICLGIN